MKLIGNSNAYKLNNKETKQVISNLEFNSKSKLFGKEKDPSLIYQVFQLYIKRFKEKICILQLRKKGLIYYI